MSGGFAKPEGDDEAITGTYDYVGIVMARSAEGDAVADVLRGKPGVEIIQQPSFWDIRSPNRMEIDFDEIAEELGTDVDAYTIQHEMSTHYGRMVATDDKLILIGDPLEALDYLSGDSD